MFMYVLYSRNNVRHLKRQIEKFKTEIDTLTQTLAQSQEENTLLEKQYLYLREVSFI